MKKLAIFFAFSIQCAIAQDFKYESLVDDPEKVRFIQAGISIWDVNINDYNIQLWNLNPRLYGYINKHFTIEAEGSRSLVDRLTLKDESFVMDGSIVALQSKYASEPASSYNLVGTWYFANVVRQKSYGHTLKSEGNVNYVSDIPTNVLRSYGVRLGYTKGHTKFDLGNQVSDLVRLDNNTHLDESFTDATTNIEYATFKIGLAGSITVNKVINTDKYGKKVYQSHQYWYLDAFLSQKFEADEMYYNNYRSDRNNPFQPELYPVSMNHKPKLPIGGCVGYRIENVAGHGTGLVAELGLIPGFSDYLIENTYLRVGLSYSFSISQKN